jgi:hypothetical protein
MFKSQWWGGFLSPRGAFFLEEKVRQLTVKTVKGWLNFEGGK